MNSRVFTPRPPHRWPEACRDLIAGIGACLLSTFFVRAAAFR